MLAAVTLPLLLTLLGSVDAQYFPAEPKDVTVIDSHVEKGVSISFKEVMKGL